MPADPAIASETTPLVHELALLACGHGAVLSSELLAAYAHASAPNSLRAFRADVLAFDAWCRERGGRTFPGQLSAEINSPKKTFELTRNRSPPNLMWETSLKPGD